MLSTSDKLEQLRWRFSWGQVLQMFGENKQRLAQWKLKSDWAKGFYGQNPIGRKDFTDKIRLGEGCYARAVPPPLVSS